VLGYYAEPRASGNPRKVQVSVKRLWVDVRLRETYRDD
jgi:hypothetical protein